MPFDFQKLHDRRNTLSLKWDGLKPLYGSPDLIPLWVADMDFLAPAPTIQALQKRVEHGIFGYAFPPPSVLEAVVAWTRKRYDWEIQEDWILFTPGVVPALSTCVLAFSKPGDKVIIQPPVYPPFFSLVEGIDRILSFNSLREVDDSYMMDIKSLSTGYDKTTRLMILSNPHNPVGRVWKRAELLSLGNWCLEHNVILISDEIHSDIIYPGHRHVPAASLSEEIAGNTVTCIAPSKTFNIAGLTTSVTIIPDPQIRARFKNTRESLGLPTNVLGLVALEAAYSNGETWLEELLLYLEESLNLTLDFFKERMPQVKARRPQGTFLAWLDFRALGLTQAELNSLLLKKARVVLNDGRSFGREGNGFQRLNFGCPRPVLLEGLERIEKALKSA